MNTYRLELIDRLRNCDGRHKSPLLSKLLALMEDNRTPDVTINRIMLDIIIKNEEKKDN